MADIKYLITLPESKDIMVAQSGETVGEYKITNINLEFESIIGKAITDATKSGYENGRDLYYPYVQYLKSPIWAKDSTKETVDINVPRKRLRAIVVLFKEKGKVGDSESFENPKITKVDVNVEGDAIQVYSKGMRKSDIYKEAVRFFGDTKHPENNVGEIDFLKSKYALVIDFRTVNEKDVVDTGQKLVSTQAGVLLEIQKEETAKDLEAHIFAVADTKASIKGRDVNLTLSRESKQPVDNSRNILSPIWVKEYKMTEISPKILFVLLLPFSLLGLLGSVLLLPLAGQYIALQQHLGATCEGQHDSQPSLHQRRDRASECEMSGHQEDPPRPQETDHLPLPPSLEPPNQLSGPLSPRALNQQRQTFP